jgi:5,10-methylenetetrahydromethanopterin reductase
MDVGVYVDAHLGIGEQAGLLERAGFTHLWVYDSPLLFGEPYMALLEAARATERIVVGPGVTHPLGRPPYVTAQGIATLSMAAPGRVVLGIGIGNSARRSLGMPPATLDTLHEHVRVVRALLEGRTVEHHEGPAAHAIRFIHPSGRWIDVSHRVPIWVSAFGPRGQRRAGESADGVLVRWEGEEALAAARERIAAGARAAGRDPDRIQIGVVYAVYPVDDPSELESEEARAALGPLVVSRLRYLTANHEHADEVAEPFRSGFEAYRRYREGLDPATRHFENYDGYLVETPRHLEHFVTPDSIRTVVHVDGVGGVASELGRMARAGVDQATLQIAGPPRSWVERMGAGVLPALRLITARPGTA